MEMNRELLSWVIENLLKNSVEAVECQNGKIEVSTGIEKSRKNAFILVTDNGRGIQPENRVRFLRRDIRPKKEAGGWDFP